MAKVGFCGLGLMGTPMAARLVDAGHEVTVWNRSPGRTEALRARGARVAGTPAEAARGAEGVVTMLATGEAVDEVVFGPDGVASALAPDATLIEMSTIGPDAVADVARKLPAGVHLLDAPVLGSGPEAEAGELKVFVGADEDVARRWMPVLEAFGAPRRVGPSGSGAAMKLVVNSTLVALMVTVGEALALADGLGLDQTTVLDVLSESRVGGTVKGKRSRIETGTYPPNFRLALAAKDAALVVDAAERAAVDAPLAAAGRRWFERARDAGLADLDYSAIIAAIRGRPASAGDDEPATTA